MKLMKFVSKSMEFELKMIDFIYIDFMIILMEMDRGRSGKSHLLLRLQAELCGLYSKTMKFALEIMSFRLKMMIFGRPGVEYFTASKPA